MTKPSIGGYQVLGELGRGATADQGAQLRQRLVREASAAGNLSHPGIVTSARWISAANWKSSDNGTAPPMLVAEGNPYIKAPEQFLALLLSHKARPDVMDSRGRTALALATENKNSAAIEILKVK